jgi:hypothetical protein
MAKLKVKVQQENQMTMRVVNRVDVIDQRRANSPDMDPDVVEQSTPHTLEYNWNAAFAHLQQEGGHVADIPQMLTEQIAPLIAAEYEAEDVEVEVVVPPPPQL